jgi:Zn-dependent peptidase ImmA (M78 family)
MTPSEQAYELLKTLELDTTLPIPLQKVLEHIGYKAQLFPASDKTRHLSCGINATDKTILANAGDPAPEQRYAFAHAIGHAVLHPGTNFVDRRQNLHFSVEEPLEEWEANQFADELVMESNGFLRKWDELNGDLGKISSQLALPRERIQARAQLLGLR